MNQFDIITCIVSLFFIFFGAIVHYGKRYSLIAGYNTLSKEKKKTITKNQLTKTTRWIRNMFCGMGCYLLIGMLAFHYLNINKYFHHYVGLSLIIWGVIICIIAFKSMK